MQLATLVLGILLTVITMARNTGSDGSMPSQQTTFRAVTSPQLGIGLCSTEQPSRIEDILVEIEMLGLLTMVPDHVLCADRCTGEQGCTGFNYKQDVGQCQMYNHVPTSCTVQPACIHYSMHWNDACQQQDWDSGKTSPGSTPDYQDPLDPPLISSRKSRHINPLTDCVVNALSWGWKDEMKYNGHITTTRNTTSTKTTNNRGFNIVELNVTKCSTSDVRIFFDTLSWSNSDSSDMADYINGLPMSTVLIGVTASGVGSGLETQGTTALLAIGVNMTGLEVWGKLAFVAQVGRPALTVMKMGPQGGDNLEIKVNVKGTSQTSDVVFSPLN